jgi:hypothetical protein
MAYVELPSSIIAVGKALKKEIFSNFRNSLIDHEARIASLAIGANPIEIFNFPILNASSAQSLTGLSYYRATSSFNISTVQIEIFQKGFVLTGTLSIDIKKGTSLDGATMTSVLTTQPSIDFSTANDYDIASGVLDGSNQLVSQGDVIRLDVTSLPLTPLGSFRVLVYGNI